MFLLLVLFFTLIPAIEIFLLIEIGTEIGAGNTILVIILTGIVGAALAKAQGFAILNKIQNDLNQGQIPANQVIHGLLVFGGGLLLLTPGFLTDAFGFCMVIPGTRHLLVQFLKNKFDHGIRSGNVKFYSFNSSAGGSHFYTNMNMNKRPFNHISEDSNVIEADFSKKDD